MLKFYAINFSLCVYIHCMCVFGPMYVCVNCSLQMHLLLVTEAQNYFCGADENLLPAARTGHVLHQAGLRKYTIQDSENMALFYCRMYI